MTVSLVAKLQNESQYVPSFASALENCIGEFDEVIVVDNGSTDNGMNLFIQNYSGIVRTISLNENTGISHAQNVGIQAATSDYILLINVDILPVPGVIPSLVSYLEDNPLVVCIGADYWYCETDNEFEVTTFVDNIDRDTIIGVNYINSNYGLSPRAIFNQIPFIEEGPFYGAGWGCEDDDWGATARSLGYQCHSFRYVNNPRVEFQCLHSGSHASIQRMIDDGFPWRENYKERCDFLNKKWANTSYNWVEGRTDDCLLNNNSKLAVKGWIDLGLDPDLYVKVQMELGEHIIKDGERKPTKDTSKIPVIKSVNIGQV